MAFLAGAARASGLADQVANGAGSAGLDRPVSALVAAEIVAAKDASSASLKLSRVTSMS